MKAVFRVDASKEMGAGHVMRTLALGQELLSRGYAVIYLMASIPEWAENRLRSEGIGCELVGGEECGGLRDASRTLKFCQDFEADWLVVDGYHFSDGFRSTVQASEYRVLLFDDHGGDRLLPAAVVLNQNAYADERLYRETSGYSVLLAGIDYCLIRNEFFEQRKLPTNVGESEVRYLVTVGGTDPKRASERILGEILEIQERKASVKVISNDRSFLASMEREAVPGQHKVELIESAQNMAECLAWADFVFTAAGSTIWECAFMNVPVAYVLSADNQELNHQYLQRIEGGVFLGDIRQSLTEEFSEAVRYLVNEFDGAAKCNLPEVGGKGRASVVDVMEATLAS
ncbi:MAG: UDP-2,4-diacetamido-2,4,6-trideoxy-beta-L-altropyranose hydrolase [Verrucomicrobiales bacterium]|nr:UDP-2,4-diacetamido-2,4,6-trideoxy-beta-L-altropyranose hydrolase [Verrucomicrobiales bacterium]